MKASPLLLVGAILLLLPSNKAKANSYKISSKFGKRINPVTGQTEIHNGIDIPLPENTPLHASGNGHVVAAYQNPTGGLQLIYKLNNGFTVGYAHLNKISVKTGQAFKKGSLLALSGKTGQVTGPHLHITMRDRTGKFIDPAPFVKLVQT